MIWPTADAHDFASARKYAGAYLNIERRVLNGEI